MRGRPPSPVVSAAARRAAGGREVSRSASAASRSVRRPVPSGAPSSPPSGTPAAARSNSSAPSSRVTSVSRPAGILISAALRHPVTGSAHASTAYVQCPSASGVTSAPQRSLPGESSRIGVQGPPRPSGPHSTTLAPTASWPSPKTVAVTWKLSPGTAFTGRRPQSSTGRTSRTGTVRTGGTARAAASRTADERAGVERGAEESGAEESGAEESGAEDASTRPGPTPELGSSLSPLPRSAVRVEDNFRAPPTPSRRTPSRRAPSAAAVAPAAARGSARPRRRRSVRSARPSARTGCTRCSRSASARCGPPGPRATAAPRPGIGPDAARPQLS